CSAIAMVAWIARGSAPESDWGCGRLPINLPLAWLPIGLWKGQLHPGYLDLGLYIDSLTLVMFCMITLISTLVHVFSIGYMRDDQRFARFFTYLSLFCFSMLGLVLGGTLLQLFIFWELVGFCSYLLIGFWYERRAASRAAIKAFVVNRIGDCGFLIGLGVLVYHVGNVTLPNLWIALGHAGSGLPIAFSGGGAISSGALTAIGIGLFFGAVGKSAQFPLHVWLADAMEGPTPVSALIHAATMVAAGVYLVARIFPILTPDAKLYIAITGAITLTMAALIATAQSDIKKVLAFSTLSQLGYMILAIGVGSWVGGMFHLITHAFFKSLLFLGAGSVIHAAGHEQEMPQFGGLLHKIPVTAITFLLAVLAISGVGIAGWGFAGYYSKDMILTHAGAFATLADHAGKSTAYWLLFVLPAATAYLTAFYMMRCWTLTFWGKPRNQPLHDAAQETPIMWLPLIALAVLATIGGTKVLGVSSLLGYSIDECNAYCRQTDPQFAGFGSAWPTERYSDDRVVDLDAPETTLSDTDRAIAHGSELVTRSASFAFLVGIVLAFACYANGYSVTDRLERFAPVRWLHEWLYRRMYFDELYQALFVVLTASLSMILAALDRIVIDGVINGVAGVANGLARACAWTDSRVVDGAVDGVGAMAMDMAQIARAPQAAGRVRWYVTALMAAMTIALAGAMLIAWLQ
ncbi:MAG: NADH-quinone oxidoreductase subunit L, partial [Phycisphaerae bacterium]|nr:NADH-quinone oxidoreductase subunit L [Phycisphaerae bacterium]